MLGRGGRKERWLDRRQRGSTREEEEEEAQVEREEKRERKEKKEKGEGEPPFQCARGICGVKREEGWFCRSKAVRRSGKTQKVFEGGSSVLLDRRFYAGFVFPHSSPEGGRKDRLVFHAFPLKGVVVGW